MPSAGGLYITGNTTAVIAGATAAKHTTGWTAFGAQRGDLTVTEDATNGELEVKPGKYWATANLTVETEDISGTSGDYAGIVHFTIRKDGTAVTGGKASVYIGTNDQPHHVSLQCLVEVDAADTGALSIYRQSTDASGNDICVTEAQFVVVPVD